MNLSANYTEPVNRIKQRILSSDNFENVAYVCCDWEEFVFEVAEWGVDHIAQVDFDDLHEDDVKALDEFVPSMGIFQKDWVWYLRDSLDNSVVPFQSGMTV